MSALATDTGTGRLNVHAVEFVFLILALIACVVVGYIRNGYWADEFSIWTDTALKSPEKVRPLNEVGRRYMDRGEFDLALEYLSKASSANYYYAPAHSNKGEIYYQLGRWSRAQDELELAIKFGPPYEDLHRSLGFAYMRTGQVGAAIKEFKKAVLLMPRHENFIDSVKLAYNNEGFFYFDRRDFKSALVLHELAASLDPGYANARYGLALAHEGLGTNERALYYWREYLRLAPQESREWRALARAHIEELSARKESQ